MRGKECVSCTELHIFWCKESSCWKLGALDDNRAGFLRCQDEDLPGEQKKSWQVVRGSLCKVRRVGDPS